MSEKYLDKNEMKLITEKSTVIEFNGAGRERKEQWTYKEQELEQVEK